MQRNLILAAITLVAIGVAVWLLRGGSDGGGGGADGEISPTGEFFSDSLGVAMRLPPNRGWTIRRDPPVPGGSYLTATHALETATWKLFVTPVETVGTLDELHRRRRDQLAGLFGVTDLGYVIDRVLQEDRREIDGFPAMQWQAVSGLVDVAGEDPIRVFFMWVATMRERHAFEGVGLLRSPAEPTLEQRAAGDSLLGDLAFIMQSMQFRLSQ